MFTTGLHDQRMRAPALRLPIAFGGIPWINDRN
jgi:hypothetical protein